MQVFVKQLVQVNNKEITKSPHYLPFVKGTTVTSGFPSQTASNAEIASMSCHRHIGYI